MAPTKIGFYSMALVFLFTNSYGQESRTILLNEFTLSANRTRVADINTENRSGFGFGAYHVFFPGNANNIILGLEYNQVRFLKKSLYAGHFTEKIDFTYKSHFLSIPLGVRLNTGTSTKLFIEAGGFADIPVRSRRKGMVIATRPYHPGDKLPGPRESEEKARLGPSVGVYAGFGVCIPVSNSWLIIKPEYKYGFNNIHDSPGSLYCRYFRIAIGLKIK